jgi:hypothetical protein
VITTDFVVLALVRQVDSSLDVTFCANNAKKIDDHGHIFRDHDDADAFIWRELGGITYRWLKHTADEYVTEWWIVADLCPNCKLAGEHTPSCIN